MKRKTRIVAFAAVFVLTSLALPAGAADRRGDSGPPQQGMSNVHQSGPVESQAKYQADYHADYRAKGTQEDSDVKGDERDERTNANVQRERDKHPSPVRERTLGRTPSAWGR
jgi:hypothetical protein